MLVLLGTNMAAIWKNASAHISINFSSVNLTISPTSPLNKLFQVILLYPKRPFTNWWKLVLIQMARSGKLTQTRELISGIKILSMVNTLLPMSWIPDCILSYKVCYQRYASQNKIMVHYMNIQAMEKIEAVTCIKFEDRSKNNHKELA